MKRFLRLHAARVRPVAIFLILAGFVVGVWGVLRAQERAWTAGTLNVAADQTARYLQDFIATRLIAAGLYARPVGQSGRSLGGGI